MNLLNNFFTKTVVLTTCITLLSSCGFQLRGYNHNDTSHNTHSNDNNDINTNPSLTIIADNDDVAFRLKESLTQQLNLDNITIQKNSLTPSITDTPLANNNNSVNIYINNIKFDKFQLVGVLTEVKITLSADISYQRFDKNNKPTIITKTTSVQKSYQYNQASVNTSQKQEQQIKKWLLESLTQRITDQYVAIDQYHHTYP